MNITSTPPARSHCSHNHARCGEAASQPGESFAPSSNNPMAEIAKLRDLANARNPYGDNAGVGSTVERGGDLRPEEIPLMCCYAVE